MDLPHFGEISTALRDDEACLNEKRQLHLSLSFQYELFLAR